VSTFSNFGVFKLFKSELEAMHIVTVNNFLICCSLEAAGYVIGYLGAIFSMISIFVCVGLTVLVALSYETLEDFFSFDNQLVSLLIGSETRKFSFV
jgi:hypothetical protein